MVAISLVRTCAKKFVQRLEPLKTAVIKIGSKGMNKN
jgi:hypothetical protein